MDNRIDRILNRAVSEGFECEVYGEVMRQLQIEVYRGELESIDRSRDEGAGIRLIRDGRVGFTFSNDLSREGLDAAFAEAKSNARCGAPMEVDVLADNLDMISRNDAELPGPNRNETNMKIEGVREMERMALGYDSSIDNTEGAGYSEAYGEVYVASTRGFFRKEKRGSCSCSISAVARKGEDIRTGWYYNQSIDANLLDFRITGSEAARRASILLDCRKIPSKRYPVIMDGTAFGDIIYLIEQVLSGEMALKGTTVFAGKRGMRVAPDIFTLVDDPFLAGGCFNASFDDEGVPRNRCVLIESGIVKGFLNNSWSSKKTGVPFTGNAVRPSYKELPVPGPTNLFMVPGEKSLDKMIAQLDEGIYILNTMGMHTADPISGDFSVGINGLYIKGGERCVAINEMTISGNILDLLGGIREVGKEIVFTGPYGAPPVLIEGLSISGT